MSCERLQESIKKLKTDLNPQTDDWGIVSQIDFYLPKECENSPTSHTARLSGAHGAIVLERFRSEAKRLIEKYQ